MLKWSDIKIQPDEEFTVEKDGFYGSYFEPETVRFPGKSMIVCTGGDGVYHMAQMVAQRFKSAGIPVMAVGYWNVPGTPKTDLECPVEYIRYASEWLREEKGLHTGMWGISLGGEYALLCGSLLPEIECVVAASPVHIVTECGTMEGGFSLTGGSPFSWHGRPVPYVHASEEKKAEYKKKVMDGYLKRREFYMRFYYEDLLMQPHDPEADIKVENTKGPILLLSGGADTCVPSTWVCSQVMDRLRAHQFKYPAAHYHYKHLSHMITPLRPISAVLFREERKNKKECNANREKAWEKTLQFLDEKWKI